MAFEEAGMEDRMDSPAWWELQAVGSRGHNLCDGKGTYPARAELFSQCSRQLQVSCFKPHQIPNLVCHITAVLVSLLGHSLLTFTQIVANQTCHLKQM